MDRRKMDRIARFVKIIDETALEFNGAEDGYEGLRFVVICSDGDVGDIRQAETPDELAESIGNLLDSTFRFGGWYDLDEEDPHAHCASWTVSVTIGPEETGNASGDLEV